MSTARWKPSPDVVARTLDGNTVLMHLETDQIYELNPTGTRLWELLSAGESLPEAKERLEGEFDAPREVVSDDVDLLLTELVDAGLVVVVKESLTAGEPSPARSAGNAWVLEFEPGRGAPPRLLEAGRDLSIWSGDAMHLWVVGCPLSEGDVAQRGAAGAEFLARRIESSSIDRVIDELRGNFTLVAWLRATDELVVVRDVVGLSPVYYTEEGRTVRLSNDLFELAGRRSAGRTVNRAVVASYVLMSGSHRQVEETFLDGIRRVPPAHLLRVGDRTQCRQYWDSLLSERQVTLNEAIPELESALETAIRRSLRGGADSLALSGGYDSVALAAIAARQCATLSAISLRLPDTDDAEWPVQRGVAAALGFPLAALDAAPRRGDDFVSRALGASRESPSPILSPWQWMFSTLLQGARAASCRGLIMGTGGDELFNVPPE
ncbi:MAG: PqqD family peptide modification chaperone, partial [Deltaproteobacteria bacterium]|nr:PqqD family peptide modification chaperone [Deltaproteobacteria bacterium]